MSEAFKPTKEFRNQMKEQFGWTDEQIDNYVLTSPKKLKMIKEYNSGRLREYKIIAEVIKSENCAEKLKKGDKFVFTSTGRPLPEETTAPLCLWALAPVLPFTYMVWDRINEGLDPNGMVFDHFKCYDVGVECGGYGQVSLKVYCVKDKWGRWGETRRRGHARA